MDTAINMSAPVDGNFPFDSEGLVLKLNSHRKPIDGPLVLSPQNGELFTSRREPMRDRLEQRTMNYLSARTIWQNISDGSGPLKFTQKEDRAVGDIYLEIGRIDYSHQPYYAAHLILKKVLLWENGGIIPCMYPHLRISILGTKEKTSEEINYVRVDFIQRLPWVQNQVWKYGTWPQFSIPTEWFFKKGASFYPKSS